MVYILHYQRKEYLCEFHKMLVSSQTDEIICPNGEKET